MSSLDSTKPLTIAITGAAGHVGTGTVLYALSQGHTVVAIDKPAEGKVPAQERYTYKQVDLLDFNAYKAAVQGCDAIIHLAAIFALRDKDGNKIDDVNQHIIQNHNSSMSWSTLCIATQLGIDRVVLASSVNSIGMVYSNHPTFDYVPVDENHAFRPEDAYSVSKYVCEIQSDAFARKYPSLRIATLRFHWVVPTAKVNIESLHAAKGEWKDLWGWVSLAAVAKACLSALTVPESQFPKGHETFFIVAGTTCQQGDSMELLKSKFPEITDIRKEFKGSNAGFFDTSKAKKFLGWEEEGFVWKG